MAHGAAMNREVHFFAADLAASAVAAHAETSLAVARIAQVTDVYALALGVQLCHAAILPQAQATGFTSQIAAISYIVPWMQGS